MNHIKNIKPTNKNYRQGYFKPNKPEKYIGDANNIIYRSSWERKFMIYCDSNNSIVNWASETLPIPYINPITNKKANYYPDFLIKQMNEGWSKPKFIIVEVKPSKQLERPLYEAKYNKLKYIQRYNREMTMYIQNLAKFAAAKDFAQQNNLEFVILTEKNYPLK